ncbi:probable chitinase 10 isoform X1 [Onthophagus taurus]|uniref:probable chitinase 10 isoform X1 n=1 Tax=Onthophagus taurus TaxID=166361 RepID=UPI0039BE49CA
MNMKPHITFCILVALCCLTPSNQRSFRRKRNLHEPPRGTQVFLRNAVESPPLVSQSDKNLEKYEEEYGSKSLPLRTAVESIPDAAQTSKRLPLRDAVEKRPPPDEADLDENAVPTEQLWQPYNNNPFLTRTTYIPLKQFQNIANFEASVQQNFRRGIFNPYYRPTRGISGKSDFFRNEQYRIQVKSDLHSSKPSEKKIICYINSEAVNRRSPMTFVPTDLDSSGDICTHVIYAYATIDSKTFEVKPKDDEYDIIQGGYKSVRQLKYKNSNLKTLISIRGSTNGVNEFNNMAKSSAGRKAFIKSVLSFLEHYGFDGVDLQWTYPGGESIKTENCDRTTFKYLLEELNETFEPMGYILSVAVPASRFKVEDGFDVKTLDKTVSFVNLLAYDFHKERDPIADHAANLYIRPYDKGLDIFTNVDYSVTYWIKKGMSPEKIVLGIPFFGRSFTLQYKNNTRIRAPILGLGREGYYTREAGFLAYYEICDKIVNEGINVQRDSTGAPYIVVGNQWIGFEDPENIRKKISYVNEKKLGGVYTWSADLDDFKGLCGEKWPLLNTIAKNLKGNQHHQIYLKIYLKICFSGLSEYKRLGAYSCTIKDGTFNNRENCKKFYFCNQGLKYEGECKDGKLFNPKDGRCLYMSPNLCLPYEENFVEKRTDDLLSDHVKQKLVEDKQKVVCYFTNWAFYRKDGKFVPENIDRSLCSHIIYAFASLDAESLMLKAFDPWADIDNNLYERITSIPDVTSMLSLGGWTDSTGNKYSRLVQDMTARRKFVLGVVDFLKKYGFNGLHLDWNYPVCWQSNCQKGPASDRNNFNKLVEELRREFDQQTPRMVLAVAISGYREVIDAAYNIPALSRHLDFMSVMTYDYHGSWEKETGHVSPLYEVSGDRYPQYNTNYTINYLVQLGAPREKLLLGIPFYGQSFTLSQQHRNQLHSPSIGPGEPGDCTNQPGMLAFYEICSKIRNDRWITISDRMSGTYAYKVDQWVGYDDVAAVEEKAKYARSNNLGGAVAWTIDLDDFNNDCCEGTFPLLKAINRGLGRISVPLENDCTKPPVPVTPTAPITTTGIDSGAVTTSPTWSEITTKVTTTSPWWTPSSTVITSTTTKTPTTSPWWISSSTTTQKTTTPHGVVRPPTTTPFEKPKCNIGEYFRDPKDCNSYYRCVQGELEKMSCAGNLHWNSNRGICDWPASAQCVLEAVEDDPIEVVTTPTTSKRPWDEWTTTKKKPTRQSTTIKTTPRITTTPTPITTTTEKQANNELDQCVDGQYYPHKECHKFFVCVNNRPVTQLCGPGLVWNVEHNRCDWKHSTSCGEREAYWSSNQQLIHRDEQKPYTSCSGGAFAAYAGDCTKYLICLWGKFEEFQCAEGLYWNDDKKVCDWPDKARCNPDTSEVIEPGLDGNPDLPESSAKPPISQPITRPTTPVPTTTTVEIPQEPLPKLSGYFKIVCYFTNWAWYRRGVGKYTPADINPDLCTHIVYGFAVLDYENLIIKPHDSWADFDNKFYEKVVEYKRKGKKVSLAIGGWNDSQGDKYSRLVNNPSARARFIKHAIEFLEKYEFDGLDLDWEYPKCWQVDCNKGPDSDKAAFAAWTTELRQAFEPRGLLLSAAVSPSKTVIDAGYDVPTIGKNLDWVAVMTYDYHGQWDKRTGHVAPMYLHPEDDVVYFNSNFTINYWIDQGVPRRKIVMGMPMYGQAFQLEKADNHGLNAPAPGPGQAGEFTRAAGFLAYYEICHKVKNEGWTVVQDPKRRIGPYAYKGNQWVSYDDKEMIQLKSEFIRNNDLGGGMIWALDLDDFNNRCGEGKHPLLKTIRRVLAEPGSGYVEVPQPPSVPVADDLPDQIDEGPVPDIPHSTTAPSIVDHNSEYKVVCYFTNWAWYRQGVGKYLPSDIDPDLCTHIVYGFAVLNGDQKVIKPHDTWADFDNKFYEKVTALKAKGIKVLIAIGGWNDSAGDKYSKLVNNPSSRKRFITDVVEFIKANNFDGLDLDWEYPKCWQVDCNKGPHSDKPAFAEFVKELREAFTPHGWLLSAAVSPSRRVIDAGYEVPVLSQYLDWIAVMCYDYHGQWDKVTGHVAPMYAHPDDIDATFNTNFTIHYWIEQGADPKKLVLGMPMYGQSFSLADNSDNGLNAPTYGGGEAGEETRARGFLSYYEICSNIQNKGWTVIRDKKMRIGPYAYQRDQWVSFDDIDMIRHKSQFIKDLGLGGGMIWALDLDDFKNICGCENYPLLRTINRVLRNYTVPAPSCLLGGPGVIIPEKEKSTTQKPIDYQPSSQKPIDTTTTSWQSSMNTGMKCTGLFQSHESSCQHYYLCNQGELVLQKCAEGLYWNKDHCDWPENTACHPDGTTINPPVTEEPTTISPDLPVITTSHKPSQPGTTPSIPSEDGYKVVCYFTNWAWYRQGDGKYMPSDIDDTLCTHINYGFAVLDPNDLVIKPHDTWADIDNEFYNRVTAYKIKGIKVLIALGGWNDSLGNKYSKLVASPEARRRFIEHAIQFITKWNFDGLDLDWEYPKCWQVDCNQGPDADKENFAIFLRELSEAFKPRGWLLTAAVSPSKMVIDAGYDVPALNQYLDWIAVMTYDYHGQWDKKTGHVAPLYYYPGDTYDYFNANFTLNYWIEQGADPKKIIMGMPLYGQSFSLADTKKHGLNALSYGPGEAGEFTRAGGFLAFYEICERVKRQSWNVVRDPLGRIGPYAYSGNQWVSYDDISEIKRKSQFVKQMNLGGGMVWALDLDDFRNRCGCGKHPLLKMMNHELRGVNLETTIDNCT